jgi:hypothetical protein
MDTLNITKNKITISFESEELIFLLNAINETLEAIEEWEFQTRTGESRERAVAIQAQLKGILDTAKQKGNED